MFKKVYFLFTLILIFFAHNFCYAEFKRVLPMAPNLVETIYALGQGDKVAAIPMFTSYPKEALEKPDAGSYLYPAFETILRLKPDIIIVQGKFNKMMQFGKKYKIPVKNVNMDSLSSIFSGIEEIGKILESEDMAEALVKKLKSEIISEDKEQREKTRVFICIGRQSGSLKQILTCGEKSFISELVLYSGGKNIFYDLSRNYNIVSKEEIVKRNPEIILDIMPGKSFSKEKRENIKKLWLKLFPGKKSINKKVYVLTDDYILIPGPRIINTSNLFKSIFKGSYKVE
ncbi:MAG: hypothetical protein CSB21_03580 [Deltaproteobacteria bacterium]|nr:MAG: hypothetical protein CSB21_03580 [Deltaproteobacteria bacterium]